MSYASEREAVGEILAGWTDCRLVWPNPSATSEEHRPSADATQAGAYAVVTIAHSSERQISMRGLWQVDGRVEIDLWVERAVGDWPIDDMASRLSAVLCGSRPENWTWHGGELGDEEIDGDWFGRKLTATFTRFETRTYDTP